jgi:dihydropteroate synthase-like protein
MVVTGRLAEESIRRKVSGLDIDVDVHPLQMSVAAFITPEKAANELSQISTRGYDLILLPGTVIGDVSLVEEMTGVPTFKGPSDFNDLPLVLGLLDKVELSKTSSATRFIQNAKRELSFTEIARVERDWKEILKERGGLVIGKEGCEVPVGSAFPMRVIAEIVNAPTLDAETVRKRALYYESEGADIIDIGMLAGKPMPEAIKELVEIVRCSVNLPISIDTLDPAEIKAAVDAGVDLVLSLDQGNLEEVASFIPDIPVVVLPSNMKEGSLPKSAEERYIAIEQNILLARNLGIRKIIADLVLEPVMTPGLFESLKAYQLFRLVDEATPVLFGLGNVTELIDADSTGVNGPPTSFSYPSTAPRL